MNEIHVIFLLTINVDRENYIFKLMRIYSICHLSMIKRGSDLASVIKDFDLLKEFPKF